MKVERPLIVGPRRFEWSPVTIPDSVEPGKVRIRTLVSLISPGTSLRLYRGEPMVESVWDSFADLDVATTEGMGVIPEYRITGRNQPSDAKYPVNCGYNLIGEVIEVGEGVQSPSRRGSRLLAVEAPADPRLSGVAGNQDT